MNNLETAPPPPATAPSLAPEEFPNLVVEGEARQHWDQTVAFAAANNCLEAFRKRMEYLNGYGGPRQDGMQHRAILSADRDPGCFYVSMQRKYPQETEWRRWWFGGLIHRTPDPGVSSTRPQGQHRWEVHT